jgi:hypothetical protein
VSDIKLTPVVSEEEINQRKHLQAVYRIAFHGDNGTETLADLGDILHFFSPAYTPEDMALQNAFKAVLHRLGAWADDEQGRLDIIRKLRS